MRILCNLPLESFDERAAMRDVELLTFGPADRMDVEGVHYPFDVAFDPSRGSWRELAARLPAGFTPDILLLYWPDQEPLPADLEDCPWQVVGVISDYNLSLPYIAGLWPFFDVLLCDRAGQDLFTALTFADVRYWNQYAHKRPFHRRFDDAPARTLDLGFAGNLNPAVQRERAPWYDRLRHLAAQGVGVEVRNDVRGAAYGRFLNRCRIGWNRSIRGEANLRTFEVPACGALLLQERGNLEIAEFFEPGAECVLYGNDDFEAVVLELLGDPRRLDRIAAAGHRRVQEHRFGNRLTQLARLLQQRGPGRPPSTRADCLLGRAVAMLPTWAHSGAVLAAAVAAQRAAPDDPRYLNVLSIANLRHRGTAGAETSWRLWQRAAQLDGQYLPAVTNLAFLANLGGNQPVLAELRRELQRRGHAERWQAIDGPTLPLRYDATQVERAMALQRAVRTGQPQCAAAALCR